jgi:outer membrane protein OmpA-like peptidoglycan-associated protein
MPRISLLCAALLILAACTPDLVDHDNGRWLVTHRTGEVDYELGGQVLFPYDSDAISPRAYDIVANVADDAKRNPRTHIEVEGFTDTSGGHDGNMHLSLARADRVAELLVRHGVKPERIHTHGFGETRLAVKTGDGVREPRNRRVVIRLIG